MPRITREMFPATLAQLLGNRLLEMIVTETEIAVQLPEFPGAGVYRVQRQSKLH